MCQMRRLFVLKSIAHKDEEKRFLEHSKKKKNSQPEKNIGKLIYFYHIIQSLHHQAIRMVFAPTKIKNETASIYKQK